MRKHQTLLVAGILLLASAGVAQAQAVYEAFTNAVVAREGGAAEKAGDVVLFLRTGTHAKGVVTVRYSAPLAEETKASVNKAEVATDVKEGTVTVTMPANGSDTITISDVRLDLREAAAPVAVTFSGDSNAFISGVGNVISAIEEALEVESTSVQILTRGDDGEATVTIEEAFATAFTSGAEVLLRITGVPDEATLDVSHVHDPTDNAADIKGDVTLNTDTKIVVTGKTQATSLMLTGDGDEIDITIGFKGPAASSTESLKLVLELDATDMQEDLELPLAEGTVRVSATMAPIKKPKPVDEKTEYFAENFIPAGGAVAFTIAPASCTLLFPYAASLPDAMPAAWNTGIAITNPSAFTDTPLSGTVKFTLFPNDGEMIVHLTDGSSSGTGLDVDGSIPAGNTYSVLLSEVLSDAGMPGDFIGHLYVETDFTGCRGVGWVTDFSTVNQAYLPYFEDGLDKGAVPSNKAGKE